MDSSFKYNTQTMQVDSIIVEDIGNCALEAIDQNGCFHYFISITNEGTTEIITFGPIVPDISILPKSYSTSFERIGYTDAKLQKAIQKWALGGKGTNFESIEQVSLEEAVAQHVSVVEHLIGE